MQSMWKAGETCKHGWGCTTMTWGSDQVQAIKVEVEGSDKPNSRSAIIQTPCD